MKRKGFSSLILVAVLAAFLPTETLAQDAAELQQQLKLQQAQMKATKISTFSRGRFSASAAKGWAWVQSQCSTSPPSDQCAAAAVMMASNQCTASAHFLKRDAKTWQYLSFVLLLSSAVFTGMGAAATAKNAKIWSTLGGTTGLGAVTSTINSNVSSDQAGLASINATLNQLITFVTTGTAKVAAAPVIATATSASGTAGTGFSYQVVASNSPTSYSATGLPAGLTVNPTSGLISGTPATAGTSTVTLGATNAGGTGNATLTLAIGATAVAAGGAVPVVSSATSASGTVGSPFAYQAAATNSPTSYTATGLPAGLSFNSTTGLISGTPTVAGTSTVTLGASNAAGASGIVTLTLTIAAAAASSGNGPAPNDLIYKVAAAYGSACASVALGSPGK